MNVTQAHGASLEPTFTLIARCRVCGGEITRAQGVPQSAVADAAEQAPMSAFCKEQGHIYNANVVVEPYAEPPGMQAPPPPPPAEVAPPAPETDPATAETLAMLEPEVRERVAAPAPVEAPPPEVARKVTEAFGGRATVNGGVEHTRGEG